jgi:hypothetical protein
MVGTRTRDLGRVLDDAMAAAYTGDADRTRRLLLLASRLAGDDLSPVLAAADAARSFVNLTSTPSSQPQRFIGHRGPPPTVLRLRLPAGVVLASIESHPIVGRAVSTSAAAQGLPRPAMRRRLGLIVLAAGLAWLMFIRGEQVWPTLRLSGHGSDRHAAGAAGAEALRSGRTAIAEGDTSSAVRYLVTGAAADGHPGDVAWQAAMLLEQLPNQEGAAATAYLRAFAAGAPPDRWPRISAALDRAGRSDEARRIRTRGFE